MGSDYREVRVIYDTTSQWLTINNAGIENADLMSNYDVSDSKTAVAQY